MGKLQCKWKGKATQLPLQRLASSYFTEFQYCGREGNRCAVLKSRAIVMHVNVIHTQPYTHKQNIIIFSSNQNHRMMHEIPRNDQKSLEIQKSCGNYSRGSSPLAFPIRSDLELGQLPGSCTCTVQWNGWFNWQQLRQQEPQEEQKSSILPLSSLAQPQLQQAVFFPSQQEHSAVKELH